MKCVVLSFRCALTALLALSDWTCLKADAVLLSSGGRVTFGECSEWCMSPLIYGNGGKLWGVSVGTEPDAAGCSACYEFMLGGRKPVKWASGKISLASEGGRVRVSLTCEVTGGDISRGGAGMLLSLPAGMFSNRVWRIDGGAWRNFPGRPLGVGFVKSAKLSSFAVDAPGGAIELHFDSPAFFSWRDPQNGNGAYLFRFAPMGQGSLAKNSLVMFSFLVSRLDGTPISPRTVSHFVVKAGKDWIPCIYRKTPEKGSALDFSCMGQLDAPAGKYGFLKACGGHFEFENRPGVPVRFWGANITSSACFPKTAELAAELAERLSRIGYNSVRIHHHDFGCVYRTGDPGRLNPDYIDRLDRFLHECIKRGLYITTDLYVSRDVKWRDIGLDRDGFVGHNRFKGEILYREAAYSNYCAFAKAFLTHVNRYTGRRYADEPALNLISLVNEGLFFSGWNSLSKEPLFRATWKSWLEQRRREDPSCFPGFSVDEPPQGIYNQKVVEGGRADILTEFSVHMEKRFYERMRAFLKGIGVKALLTDVNFGPSRPGMKELRRNFDYIDMHFYYEHPKKAGGRTFIPNRHPLDRPEGEGLQFDSKRYHDRPFTVSEYNWSGPCAWRGTGALIGAAVASLQDWSGIWRFAYAQHSRVLPENAEGPRAFDVAVDPVNYVAERAAIALYLRGDMPAMPYKGAFRLPELNNSFFRTDAKTLSAVVDTERTVGGCALAGNSIKAGAMDVHVQGSPACVWATTLDGCAIKKSKRILFAHLTDVLGEGTEFLDSTRRHLLKWGKRPLVQTGIADVRIQLDSSNAYRVYRLDMAGVRCGVVESRMQNGTLSFRADVAYNPQSATICYEICDVAEDQEVSERNGLEPQNPVKCRKVAAMHFSRGLTPEKGGWCR